MKKLRVGVIGCGVIAPTHIEAYQQHDHVEVVRLCDLIEEKAQRLAETFSVPDFTSDPAAFIASDLDAISVCTDHASHAELCVSALEAGKHVLCEKALAQKQEGLSAIVAAGDASPELVLSGVFQHRFDLINQTIQTLIEGGELGQMLTASIQMRCFRSQDYYNADHWRGTWDGEGGSVLINQAIHYIDLLRWTMGGIDSLVGLHANLTHNGSIETEDTAVAALQFTSGALGTIEATCSSHIGWEPTLTYHGTKGSLELRHDKPTKIAFADKEVEQRVTERLQACSRAEKVRSAKTYYGSGHGAQIADFVQAVADHRAPFVTARSAAQTVDLVLSLYESQQTLRPVALRKTF